MFPKTQQHSLHVLLCYFGTYNNQVQVKLMLRCEQTRTGEVFPASRPTYFSVQVYFLSPITVNQLVIIFRHIFHKIHIYTCRKFIY